MINLYSYHKKISTKYIFIRKKVCIGKLDFHTHTHTHTISIFF